MDRNPEAGGAWLYGEIITGIDLLNNNNNLFWQYRETMVEETSSSSPGVVGFSVPPGRQRFHIELRTDETTFVSWKKLIKDSQKAVPSRPVEPPVGAHPALEARIAPEATTGDSVVQTDPVSAPSHRFSAVIERIERLYKGTGSSDEEELDKIPDDDQYDTEDSFIDDAELDEYFSVDGGKTKHTGFFINRGKLEHTNEPAASPVLAPKKRRRKDTKKMPNDEEIPSKLSKTGALRIKAAARSGPLVGMNATGSGQDITCLPVGEYSDEKPLKKQESKPGNVHVGPSSLKAERCKEVHCKTEPTVAGIEVFNKDGAIPNISIAGSKETTVKKAIMSEPSDGDMQYQSDKHTTLGTECHTRQLMKCANDMSTSNKSRAFEKVDEGDDSVDVNPVVYQISTSKIKPPLPGHTEASPARPKCTILDKAFQDLEKGVAELCPPSTDIRESDQSCQVVKKRIPRDVKQKLGKVARLAAKQGKISNDVINRLMGILGHVMRLKTLKRNLKEMIASGISAKQEKEGRLEHIKKEVTEMVQMQVSSLKAHESRQEGSLDDLQAVSTSVEKGKLNGCYKWDYATEDRLCDLYDQYVEGMDEHKGPQIKKLYIELAELWPEGWMDNNGIKHAVYRAKERKKKLNKITNGGGEVTKRKKAPVKLSTDGWNGDVNTGTVSNPSCEDSTSRDKQTMVEQAHNESLNRGNILQYRPADPKSSSIIDRKQKHFEKGENKGSDWEIGWNKCVGIPPRKKKSKPKTDLGIENTYTGHMKACSFEEKETNKLDQEGLHGMSVDRNGSIQIKGLPASEVVRID